MNKFGWLSGDEWNTKVLVESQSMKLSSEGNWVECECKYD